MVGSPAPPVNQYQASNNPNAATSAKKNINIGMNEELFAAVVVSFEIPEVGVWLSGAIFAGFESFPKIGGVIEGKFGTDVLGS